MPFQRGNRINVGRMRSEETKRKMSITKLRNNNPNYSGGKTISRGYTLIKIYDRNKYIREHRLVYEESRDCCLLQWVIIHHIDGDKKNNIWYNLIPMTQSKHRRLH